MLLSILGISQTVLTPGDVAILAFNGDDPDAISWVPMVDLAAGTQIKFTDNGWNGTALTTTEGTLTWTASSAVAKGTVMALTITGISLGTTGDQIFAYQGAATSPSFIFGLSTNNWVTGNISQTTSRRPATLTVGSSCISFSTERDNGYFSTVSNSGDKSTFLASICNANLWTRSDTRYASFPAWSFTFNGPAAEPSASPTNLTFTNVKSYEYTLSFTAASPAPAGYLVVRSVGAPLSADPIDGTAYTVGSAIGNATVVSLGTSLNFTDKSVIAATNYYYKIFSYLGSGSGINYGQASPLTGNVTSAATMVGTYYSAVSNISPDFVTQLKNRVRSPYTKVSYDLYDETMVMNFAFNYAPNGQKTVTCAYSGEVYAYTPPFAWYTVSPFSREHTWCVSWMPSGGGTSLNEYADQHHLFPVNQNSANNVRSNHPLGNVTTITSSYLQGKYGLDAAGNLVYEPRAIHKGDAARALLYMSLRYDGVNGFNWTFNQLNNVILPGLSEDPQDLATLLAWHNQDPPDNYEIARNDFIWSQQQNRNPFIDNPAWVNNINFGNLTWLAPTAMPEEQPGSYLKSNSSPSFNEMLMYPNPAGNLLNLGMDASDEGRLQVDIFSMHGALVRTSSRQCNAGVNLWQEDISELSGGIYQVVMQYGAKREVMRLVVE